MTRYEQLIFRIVNESRDHLTAEQVFERLRETCPGVSLATVYNNLKKLVAAGLVRKVTVEGSPDRYDRVERHDHLVCQQCGALADATFADLTESLKSQVGDGFMAYDLKVYYLCPQCRAQAEREGADANPARS